MFKKRDCRSMCIVFVSRTASEDVTTEVYKSIYQVLSLGIEKYDYSLIYSSLIHFDDVCDISDTNSVSLL